MTNKVKPFYKIPNQDALDKHKIVWNRCSLKYVKEYDYSPENIPVIINLIYYINGLKGEFDLNKGLLICGNVGTGKTFLFKILQTYVNATGNPNSFRIESVESMKSHFEENGNFRFYNEYKSHSNRYGLNMVINEFGIDYDASFYGTKFVESFGAFFMQRYELFEDRGTLTHITTNLNLQELEKKLDPAMLRRFRAMFNIIPLGGKSYT